MLLRVPWRAKRWRYEKLPPSHLDARCCHVEDRHRSRLTPNPMVVAYSKTRRFGNADRPTFGAARRLQGS
jgi:hypothetical protein